MRIWIFWSETNPICLLSHELQYEGDVGDVERAEVHNEEQEQLRLPRPENQELRCHCGTGRLNCMEVQVNVRIGRIGLNDVCSVVTQDVWLTSDNGLTAPGWGKNTCVK